MKPLSIIKNAAAAGVVALLGNMLIYVIAQKMFGVEFLLPAKDGSGLTTIPWWDIPISSFLPAIFGGLIFLLLAKYSKKPERIFMIISAIVLALSFIPLVIDASIGVKVSFALMHILAASVIVWFLIRRPI